MSLPAENECQVVEDYFKRWWEWVRAESAIRPLRGTDWREREPLPPISAMKSAALSHPNPRVRRECLSVLDHHANEASADVFREALKDPVPRVRLIALHGLACERCRASELCAADVVPDLVRTATEDPSPKVRHETIGILLRLSTRDSRAKEAIASAAGDADGLVRAVARAALEGRTRDIRSRRALRRRSDWCAT